MLKEDDLIECVQDSLKGHIENVASLDSLLSSISQERIKDVYKRQVVVLVSVLMGVLPFVLAYHVISPLVMGDSVETEVVLLRVIGVLICLVLQAVLYGWGLSISHKAAYNTCLLYTSRCV